MNGPWILALALVPSLSPGAPAAARPVPAALPRPARPAVAEPAEALLFDDLRFAENLARLQLFDLAFDVIGRVKAAIERTDAGDELEGEASLTEARIHRLRGDVSTDPAVRSASIDRAIELLRDWTRPGSPFAYHDRLVDALEELAVTLRLRGERLTKRWEQEGDEEARERAASDFREADETYDDLEEEASSRADIYEQEELEDLAASLRARAFSTFYQRGINSISWAAVADDREFRLEQAVEQLDEFMWEVTEDQLVYYSALYEQARAMHLLGELGEAHDILGNALDLGTEQFWDYIDEYDPTQQALIASLFDRLWGYRARLEAEEGDLAAAEAWVETLLAEHDRHDIPLGRSGHRVLLDWVGTLDRLGRAGQATELVKRVAEEGRGTPEGVEAENLLARLVQGGPIDSVSVLMFTANAAYRDERWGDAAYSYLRAADKIETPEDREQFAQTAWMRAGHALRRARRYLEAALAFEHALDLALETPEDLGALEDAANAMSQMYDQRYQETGLAFDKALRDTANARLVDMEGLELDLQFMSAVETFTDVPEDDPSGYEEAYEQFLSVPQGSPNYERALVFAARCLVELGRLDEALAQFEQLEARFTDPALEPASKTARDRREGAIAQSRFRHAELLLDERVARPDDALALLRGFEEAVESQPDFHELAKWQRVQAHAMKGDIDAARDALDVLIESGASSNYVASAAYRVATAAEGMARARQKLGDAESARTLLVQAADAMWTYAEADGFTSLTNVTTAGDWYLEAGRPEEAERVYTKALEVHEGTGARNTELDRARIGLATALDRQSDFGRSRPLWKDLYSRNPTTRIQQGAARCFGGWLEIDEDGNVSEVPGSGDYLEAFEIWGNLQKRSGVNNKFTRLWWEAKLGTIYTLYRQRNVSSERARQARALLDNLKISYPQYDAGTMEFIPEEQRYDDILRPAFRYLDRNLPTS